MENEITKKITADLSLLTVFIIDEILNPAIKNSPAINNSIKIKTKVQYENKNYAVALSIKEIE